MRHLLFLTTVITLLAFCSESRSVWKKEPRLFEIITRGQQLSKGHETTEEDVNHNIGLDKYLFESDIVMDKKTADRVKGSSAGALTRNAIADKTKHWDPSAIPYVFDITEHNPAAVYAVKTAISELERLTCLRFVERSTETDYIYFFPGNGCWSYVGKKGGRQLISVGPGCELTGIVLHELSHSLGFYHEQSRADRDDFVKIEWENIKKGTESNFLKYSHGEIDHLNEPYDYGSITHYGPKFFSKDGKLPTISKLKPGGPKMGQRKELSAIDVNQMNKLYHCTGYINNRKPIISTLSPSSHPSVVENGICTFDEGMCVWENLANDQFDWTRQSGPTPSRDTGPTADHTTGSGHYLYIESSYPREKDDAALLSSGYYNGTSCFTFAYNMYGASTGVLRVWEETETGSFSKLWEKSGDNGAAWHTAAVNFPNKNLFKVIIEGVVGASWQSDIALDDLQIRPGQCSGK